MNRFELNIQKILNEESLTIDGIEFTKAILVRLLIDGLHIEKLKFLEVALVVFSELLKSLSGNGLYLIFTSASGVADDGGWEGVTVRFDHEVVYWDFDVEDESYHFEFERSQYDYAIRKLVREIALVSNEVKVELEPADIFFPESWG